MFIDVGERAIGSPKISFHGAPPNSPHSLRAFFLAVFVRPGFASEAREASLRIAGFFRALSFISRSVRRNDTKWLKTKI
jgi:hypothetical protein